MLIGLQNTGTQTLTTGATANLGSIYRLVSINSCNDNAYTLSGNSITLNNPGVYEITVTAIVSAPAAGDVTLQLQNNGTNIDGALATESITTATTEFHTLTINRFILNLNSGLLFTPTTISLVNTGIGSTITNLVMNIKKAVIS